MKRMRIDTKTSESTNAVTLLIKSVDPDPDALSYRSNWVSLSETSSSDLVSLESLSDFSHYLKLVRYSATNSLGTGEKLRTLLND